MRSHDQNTHVHSPIWNGFGASMLLPFTYSETLRYLSEYVASSTCSTSIRGTVTSLSLSLSLSLSHWALLLLFLRRAWCLGDGKSVSVRRKIHTVSSGVHHMMKSEGTMWRKRRSVMARKKVEGSLTCRRSVQGDLPTAVHLLVVELQTGGEEEEIIHVLP